MDVAEILTAAVGLATEGFGTDAGLTMEDVRRELRCGEWEFALELLADVSDEHPQCTRFWLLLTEAADHLQLDRDVAWCRWRGWESLHGVIRADLILTETEAGGRRSAIPGAGELCAMWDIGHRTTAGEPELALARLWVEYAPALEPGHMSSVRLAPLNPPTWRHLTPGDMVTMHEEARPTGFAEIISILPPVAG